MLKVAQSMMTANGGLLPMKAEKKMPCSGIPLTMCLERTVSTRFSRDPLTEFTYCSHDWHFPTTSGFM